MAIVINPDGTVSTIETTHDRYGNLRPKIVNPDVPEISSTSTFKQGVVGHNSKPRKKKSYISTEKISTPLPTKKVIRTKGTYRPFFTSVSEIDDFFEKRKENGREVFFIEYSNMADLTPANLQPYFKKKYFEYRDYCKLIRPMTPRERDKLNNKIRVQKKATKGTKPKHRVTNANRTGNTIGEIAKFGSLKGEYASSSDFDVRTSNPPRPARTPQYGYARDRYGRVQERDSYNEEKRNEFYVAQNRQRNYDYSCYDDNDDNDRAYSDWE